MFKENKYTKWYFKLVHLAKSKNRTQIKGDGYERHHIIPKSMGGNNSNSNIVVFSLREHFIAHLLLTKMTISEEHTNKMIYALFNMKTRKNNNSHMYKYYKEKWQALHSERQQKIMSDPNYVKSLVIKRKKTLEDNPYIKIQIYDKLRGTKRPNGKYIKNILTGNDRTNKQRTASLEHRTRMKGRTPWNKGKKGHSKPISTPNGIFRTLQEAANYYKLTNGTIYNRCQKNLFGFGYVENETT